MRAMPGVLVRPAQRTAALSRFHAGVDEVHRRALLFNEANALAITSLSAMRGRFDAGAQHGSQRPLRLLAMSERARALHRVFRIPQGKEFHPSALAGGDPAFASERPDRELLELRRGDRLAKQLGMPLLSCSPCHPGPEPTAANAGAAQRSRRA